MTRRRLIEAARGDASLDIVIRGAKVLNVYTLELRRADIGLLGDRIAIVDDGAKLGLQGRETLEVDGLIAVPGYVDAHVHIESSFVTPTGFAQAVLPFGTTTVVIDPHEICNVMGLEGFEYMLLASEHLPLRVFVTVPSSVPAVPELETSGARFEAADIAQMLEHPRVVGVAELMDYPGVIRGRARTADIVEAGLRSGKILEGHAPLLGGRDLAAYLAAGVDADHECRSAEEMIEKIRAGMWVYGRENTFRHTGAYLAQALRELPHAWNVALCTDDTDPDDLLRHGHLDRGVRALLEGNVDPALAYRVASLGGATRFSLRDLGAIGAGKFADILLLEALDNPTPRIVMAGGRVVARDGQMTLEFPDPQPAPRRNTVSIAALTEAHFTLHSSKPDGLVAVNLLEIDAVRTTRLASVSLPFQNGQLELPLPDDLLLLSVVPRHGQTHPPSLTLLRGLGLRSGALATTVAHDSHNLIVAGKHPSDMLLAIREVQRIGGGAAIVSNGEVLATLELEVAGLMSDASVHTVAAQVSAFNAAARGLGLGGPSPVMAISSLALPVAPFYRLTDLGLVDTLQQEFVKPL